VLDSAQQAIGLINDLLDLSRLDEDRLRPVIRAVEPGAIARRAEGRVTPAAAAKGVTVSLDIGPDLPTCDTDASRVEQILVNLLGNAIQHTPQGTGVHLQITSGQGLVTFVVADEGSGVPEGEAERIFDIYVTKPREDGKGVGLGLPLSRRLARLLGGELRAKPGPGGGRFILELPVTKGA
jgi:signal transduction histidine kinase